MQALWRVQHVFVCAGSALIILVILPRRIQLRRLRIELGSITVTGAILLAAAVLAYYLMLDVPLGRYIATARLMYGSRPKSLRLATYTIDPGNPNVTSPEKLPTTKVPVEFDCVQSKPGQWRLLQPNLVAFQPDR